MPLRDCWEPMMLLESAMRLGHIGRNKVRSQEALLNIWMKKPNIPWSWCTKGLDHCISPSNEEGIFGRDFPTVLMNVLT